MELDFKKTAEVAELINKLNNTIGKKRNQTFDLEKSENGKHIVSIKDNVSGKKSYSLPFENMRDVIKHLQLRLNSKKPQSQSDLSKGAEKLSQRPSHTGPINKVPGKVFSGYGIPHPEDELEDDSPSEKEKYDNKIKKIKQSSSKDFEKNSKLLPKKQKSSFVSSFEPSSNEKDIDVKSSPKVDTSPEKVKTQKNKKPKSNKPRTYHDWQPIPPRPERITQFTRPEYEKIKKQT